MSMQLDYEQLHKLLEALSKSDIQEFRLEGDDFRVEIRRNLPNQQIIPHESNNKPSNPQSSIETITSSSPPPVASSFNDLLEISAPMVGTFYRAPAPGESSFVEVGSRINIGQTVCILEAMKLMNELEAEVSGEVVEILVDNGTPVEFGQVLMRVKPL